MEGGGGWLPPPSTRSLSNFRAKPYVRSENFFMERCPKDEPTAKNLVCKKSSSHFLEKLGKPVGGMWHPPPPPGPLAIGGLIDCTRCIFFKKHFQNL